MKLKTLLYTQKHILWMSVSVFIVVLLVLSLYNISRISNATALTNTVVCSMRSSSHEFHSISNLNETMLMYNNKYVFENDEKLESSIISLLKSCTDRNRRLVSQNDWQNIMSSYSFIMVSFRPPKCINTSVRSNLIIDAILVPPAFAIP